MSEKDQLVATLKKAIDELDEDCRKAGACVVGAWPISTPNLSETIERRIQCKRGAITNMLESLARGPCE